MFSDTYKLDQPNRINKDHSILPDVRVGSYNSSLLTLTDENLLETWQWRLGGNVQLVAYTAFGDFYFIDTKTNRIFFFNVQYGTTTFVDEDPKWFLNEFLTNSDIIEKVLNIKKFDRIRNRIEDSLNYLECYIPVPWPMLGGSGHADTYEIGGILEYMTLVSQTMNPKKKTPFEITKLGS